MKRMGLAFLAALAAALPPLALAQTTVEIWVAPSGSDQNSGAKDAPVATLARAQELERQALTENPKPAVTVWLRPGDYLADAGWKLTAQDSGSDSAPVVWRGTEPGKARLLGCRDIPMNKWSPLDEAEWGDRLAPAAKGHIRQIDFASAGLPALKPIPDCSANPALPVQLYYHDESLPLSRWPNGPYGYTTMQSVLDNGGSVAGDPHGATFVYRGDEPERWIPALADEGVWLRGFWRVPWEAQTLRVKSIDPANKTVTFAVAVPGGVGSKYSKVENGVRAGNGKENWCAVNLLEEIDAPGQWSIDFQHGRIYLWPPGDDAIRISNHLQALVTFDGASHVEMRNLVLGWSAGDGVSIRGGDHVTLASCELHQVAGRGVVIDGGSVHSILGNDIYDVGLSAIDVSGGDRVTLTPAADEICNNLLCRVALASPVPALVAGHDAGHQNVVGIHVAHNCIDGASYGGITFAGNDNIFEYNEIERIGLDGGDLGAFYTSGGWTSRGNVVRYNFIHHSANANGIYMDDGDSGLLAYGNLIYKVNSALFIGGGHDNILRNNLLVACERAMHVDDRGFSRNYTADDHRLRGDFDSIPVQSAVWTQRYPGVAEILKSDPRLPSGNVLEKNIAVQCGALVRRSGAPEHLDGYQFTDDAEVPSEDIFTDPATLDFHLKDPTALTQAVPGFEALPLEQMGLLVDANRASVPPRDLQELDSPSAGRRTFDSQQDVDSSQKKP